MFNPMRKFLIFLFCVSFSFSVLAGPKPLKICFGKDGAGNIIEVPCISKPKAPPNDENTCNPYCDQSGQWCTDCKGVIYPNPNYRNGQ